MIGTSFVSNNVPDLPHVNQSPGIPFSWNQQHIKDWFVGKGIVLASVLEMGNELTEDVSSFIRSALFPNLEKLIIIVHCIGWQKSKWPPQSSTENTQARSENLNLGKGHRVDGAPAPGKIFLLVWSATDKNSLLVDDSRKAGGTIVCPWVPPPSATQSYNSGFTCLAFLFSFWSPLSLWGTFLPRPPAPDH